MTIMATEEGSEIFIVIFYLVAHDIFFFFFNVNHF